MGAESFTVTQGAQSKTRAGGKIRTTRYKDSQVYGCTATYKTIMKLKSDVRCTTRERERVSTQHRCGSNGRLHAHGECVTAAVCAVVVRSHKMKLWSVEPVPVERRDLGTLVQICPRTSNEKVSYRTLCRHSADECARAGKRKRKEHRMERSKSCGT